MASPLSHCVVREGKKVNCFKAAISAIEQTIENEEKLRRREEKMLLSVKLQSPTDVLKIRTS